MILFDITYRVKFDITYRVKFDITTTTKKQHIALLRTSRSGSKRN